MFLQNAIEFLPILLKGAIVTIEITVCSFVLSSVLGLVLALMKVSRNRAVSMSATTVINVIRGLPIIVQLVYIYFVLPDIGIQLSAFQAGFYRGSVSPTPPIRPRTFGRASKRSTTGR
jgi:polar amino acid transport system permease protein